VKANRLLSIFFALAVAMQLAYLLVGFASQPAFYQRVTTQSVATTELYGKVSISNEIIAQEAAERGLSLQGYALYRMIFNSLVALIPAGVALLIIRHAGWQWFAWFTAFIVLFLGEYSLGEQMQVARLISQELYGANAIFWFLVLLFLFLFPNGRVVPPRLGWVVISLVAYHFFVQVGTVLAYLAPEFADSANLPNWGSSWYVGPVLLNFIFILASQVYRYRRVSTSIERQQTKWFLLGFGLIVLFIPVPFLTGNQGGFLDDLATVALYTPLPIALAFAILRYHLWDIDIIIRRTLVYAGLTASLALVYFGGVVLVETLLRPLAGGESQLAIILTTLAIAALVSPLRRRIQDFIDKRFYRQKYNAEQALAEFASLASQETDLRALTDKLVDVVRETVQPVEVSLWLRGNKRLVENGLDR
jgi:hypothetical protein